MYLKIRLEKFKSGQKMFCQINQETLKALKKS